MTTASGSVPGPADAAGPAAMPAGTLPARLGAALRPVLPALVGYVAVRLLGLVVLAVAAARADRPLLGLLTHWDGGWYIGIATDGYDTSVSYAVDGTLRNTNIAFFPLFPWLIRAVAVLGVPPGIAAVVVANLAGLAAAWGIALVGARLADRRVGLLLAVLWGALPHAVVTSMAYSESLFTALSAWALWAVLGQRFLLAGALAGLAGLTRPTAAAIIAAVGVACLVEVIRGRRPGPDRPGGWRATWRDGGWRTWAAGMLAPAGMLAYLAWCAGALGRADAYFWMQSQGWGQAFDFGYTTLHELALSATRARPLAMHVTSVVVAAAVVLFALLVRDAVRPGTPVRRFAQILLPVLVFTGVLLLTVLVQGGDYYYAKARFLIPAFPLLLPLAAGLAALRPWARYGILAVLAGFSAWYGSYLLLTWHLSP